MKIASPIPAISTFAQTAADANRLPMGTPALVRAHQQSTATAPLKRRNSARVIGGVNPFVDLANVTFPKVSTSLAAWTLALAVAKPITIYVEDDAYLAIVIPMDRCRLNATPRREPANASRE